MKKILLVSLTALLCAALSVPAMAVENQFGGYWRTRAFTHTDFNGTDTLNADVNKSNAMKGSESFVDTRTRLYYTAVFSPDFKFVNKFEFNNVWGDKNGGDISADGVGIFRIKNSYVDFNLGSANFKIGEQAGVIARGFLLNDDFSGLVASFKIGSMVTLPFYYIKISDLDIDRSTGDALAWADSAGANGTQTKILSKYSVNADRYALTPIIKINDSLTITPYVMFDKVEGDNSSTTYKTTYSYFEGVDVDVKIKDVKLWGTAIGENGKMKGIKQQGYLAALGADAGLVHAQAFYASGDKADTTDKNEGFGDITDAAPSAHTGRIYYWSEIMGYGIFDNVASNNSPADKISNIKAANIGVTLKPTDKLTVTGDIWYARKNEPVLVDNENQKYLGTELDLVASYKLMPNLQLDLVGAYLFAGDATKTTGVELKDPIEFGAQLSLSF